MTRSFRVRFFGSVLLCAVHVSAGVQAQPTATSMLQRLHADLALNSSQEAAWNSFVHAYEISPQDIARVRNAGEKMPSLTGPQRVDLAISLSEQDLAGLRRRAEALKVFYAILSPQQQKIFDRDTL